MIDNVNGIVIGPVTIEKARKQYGPDECKRLGYDKAWELRIY